VNETKEENISPNPQRPFRYKLSKRFNFSDKYEDNLNKKKWLSEVFKNRLYQSSNQILRSESCVVRPIEEVTLKFYFR